MFRNTLFNLYLSTYILLYVFTFYFAFPFSFQVIYLRRFKKLRTLNLNGNPFCEQPDYKQHVIAYISSIDFLDYRLIDQQSVSMTVQLTQFFMYLWVIMYTIVLMTYSFEVQLLEVKPLCKKNVLKPRICVYTLTVLIYMNKTIMKWGPCLLA